MELVYTKFVSLISSAPVIQTLLPLSPSGEVCDVNGVCVDAAEDEIFKLTTKEGQLVVDVEKVREGPARPWHSRHALRSRGAARHGCRTWRPRPPVAPDASARRAAPAAGQD